MLRQHRGPMPLIADACVFSLAAIQASQPQLDATWVDRAIASVAAGLPTLIVAAIAAAVTIRKMRYEERAKQRHLLRDHYGKWAEAARLALTDSARFHRDTEKGMYASSPDYIERGDSSRDRHGQFEHSKTVLLLHEVDEDMEKAIRLASDAVDEAIQEWDPSKPALGTLKHVDRVIEKRRTLFKKEPL